MVDPRYTNAILGALQSHVRQNVEWEVCDWQDLSADTPLAALGPLREDTPCSQVALAGCFEEFLAAPRISSATCGAIGKKRRPRATFASSSVATPRGV
jgi:hypothetical protein